VLVSMFTFTCSSPHPYLVTFTLPVFIRHWTNRYGPVGRIVIGRIDIGRIVIGRIVIGRIVRIRFRVVSRTGKGVVNIKPDGQKIEQIKNFRYLGNLISEDGRRCERSNRKGLY